MPPRETHNPNDNTTPTNSGDNLSANHAQNEVVTSRRMGENSAIDSSAASKSLSDAGTLPGLSIVDGSNHAGVVNTKNADGSSLTNVTYPDGQSRGFSFGSNGALTQVRETDGSLWKPDATPSSIAPGGSVWRQYDSGGQATGASNDISNVSVSADGKYSFTESADKSTRVFQPDGKGTVINAADGGTQEIKPIFGGAYGGGAGGADSDPPTQPIPLPEGEPPTQPIPLPGGDPPTQPIPLPGGGTGGGNLIPGARPGDVGIWKIPTWLLGNGA